MLAHAGSAAQEVSELIVAASTGLGAAIAALIPLGGFSSFSGQGFSFSPFTNAVCVMAWS
jgi:hypothetical protein